MRLDGPVIEQCVVVGRTESKDEKLVVNCLVSGDSARWWHARFVCFVALSWSVGCSSWSVGLQGNVLYKNSFSYWCMYLTKMCSFVDVVAVVSISCNYIVRWCWCCVLGFRVCYLIAFRFRLEFQVHLCFHSRCEVKISLSFGCRLVDNGIKLCLYLLCIFV